jgi:hypothetical protein
MIQLTIAKVDKTEKETLWEIRDCQALLKTRVSDIFVNEGIQAVRESLQKELAYTEKKQIDRLEKSFQELGQRIVVQTQYSDEKFRDIHKVVSAYDHKFKNLVTLDKVQTLQGL